MVWDLSKTKVLFVCVKNSARSQIAEEYLRKLGGDDFIVESAGIEAGNLDPIIVEVMSEEGVDLSEKQTNDIWDLYKKERAYDWVITVCDKKWEERCPVFPGIYKRDNWGLPDPATFKGSENEKLRHYREIRDMIKSRIHRFIEDIRSER